MVISVKRVLENSRNKSSVLEFQYRPENLDVARSP